MTADDAGTPVLDPAALFAAVRELWTRRDPVPADLAERIVFALSLEDLEVEVARLEQDLLTGAGARGEERMRTVTFASTSMSVMVMIGGTDGAVRLDGWVEGRPADQVELRRDGWVRGRPADGVTVPDADGRFAFDDLAPGLVQLVFHLGGGSVVTPAFQV